MATNNIYCATGLTGGTSGALDSIDGADLSDKDMAIVMDQTYLYVYVLDDDSGASESSPYVISPNDNADDKRWLLQGIQTGTANSNIRGSGGTGYLNVGDQGSNRGILSLFGTATNSGGWIILYTADDSDGNTDNYQILVEGEDLKIGPVGGTEALTYFGGSSEDYWKFNDPVQFVEAIKLLEKGADPTEPSEGQCVIWMSDGTGKGDDGDVMIASKAGGATKVGTLFDHSGGDAW